MGTPGWRLCHLDKWLSHTRVTSQLLETIKSKRRLFHISRGIKNVLATVPKLGSPGRKRVQGVWPSASHPAWPEEHEATWHPQGRRLRHVVP